MMRNFLLILMGAFLVTACAGGGNKSGETETDNAAGSAVSQVISATTGVVNIYYFHGVQRCKTCIAIENVAADVYEKQYSENEDVNFKVFTIGEDAAKTLEEKYKVTFSSLIVASGDSHIDLTEQGFAYAVNKPEVLADLMKNEIEKYLE